MMERVAFRTLVTVLVVALAAAQAYGGTAPPGPADPGVMPPDDGFGPMEFWENFDGYANGSEMDGQGGWHGWDGLPGFGALVTDAQAFSTPHSVDIVGASDLVQEFSGYTSGQWVVTAWTYVPTGTTLSYFIMLNTYADGGPYNWSVQISFDEFGGVVNDGAAGGSLPVITDTWVELRIEVDLDGDTQTAYYGGDLLYTQSWSDGVSGGGVVNIAAIDLFANGASSVFYDNVSVCPAGGCLVPVELQSVEVD